jgi:hypothetical protein
MNATYCGVINIVGNYQISGGAGSHYSADGASNINLGTVTCTIIGTPNFSAFFANANRGGIIQSAFATTTFSGAVTGTRYAAGLNAVIDTNGKGANYFPGNSAGVTATGGQYA